MNSSSTALSTEPVGDVGATFAAELESWATKTAPEGYHFDEREAARVCAFFPRYLRHTKGQWAGRPFVLEDWERGTVRVAFGWKRPDGTRRFRIIFIYVARKNGKTTLGAGLALVLTFADDEQVAEVYSVANDKEQAAICFDEAARMRKQSPPLASRSICHKLVMRVPTTDSIYRVLSSDSGTKDGLNPHGIVYDEFHAMTDRLLYDVLHTAVGARTQPMEIIITTAGLMRDSICNETLEYARKVRDGIIDDPEFLPVIFEADKEDIDRVDDPAVWAKANPNLGRTISREYMAKEAAKAKGSPAYLNAFARLHLNIQTEQHTRWLSMEKWDASAGPVGWRDMATHLEGRECYGGLDLATREDITAFVLVFPDDDEFYDLLPFFWVPEEGIALRTRRDRAPYADWARGGVITATDGDLTDYDVVRNQINEAGAAYSIQQVGFDRWNASQIVTQLTNDGLTMVDLAQGHQTMGAPTKAFGDLVRAGKMRHGGHPVLRWMASNMVVRYDANANIVPDRKKATEKIDGIVAAIMALQRATVGPRADNYIQVTEVMVV